MDNTMDLLLYLLLDTLYIFLNHFLISKLFSLFYLPSSICIFYMKEEEEEKKKRVAYTILVDTKIKMNQ